MDSSEFLLRVAIGVLRFSKDSAIDHEQTTISTEGPKN